MSATAVVHHQGFETTLRSTLAVGSVFVVVDGTFEIKPKKPIGNEEARRLTDAAWARYDAHEARQQFYRLLPAALLLCILAAISIWGCL